MIGTLFRWVSLSHLRDAGVRGALTFFGIVLGVAVFGAIRIASENARAGFEHSASVLGGTARIVIASPTGSVPEQVVRTVRDLPGVRSVVPVMVRYVPYHHGERPQGLLRIVGTDLLSGGSRTGLGNVQSKSRSAIVDLLRNPRGALVTPLLAEDLGTVSTLTIAIGPRRLVLEVQGTVGEERFAKAFGGRTAVLDIANMQDLFEEWGAVDELNVIPNDAADEVSLRRTLSERLPAPLVVREPGEEARYAERVTASFRMNLNFLAGISLFVALLLVYNSVSYAVLRRRREIGILMSVGAAPRALFGAAMTEALLVGIAASVVGLCGAYLLSLSAVTAVTRTISALYLPVSVRAVELPASLVIECILLGSLVSAAGAFAPCLEIFSISPREAFGYQTFEARFRRRVSRIAAVGAALLAGAVLASRDEVLALGPYAGFISPALFLVGAMLIIPLWLELFIRAVSARAGRELRVSVLLAIDHVRMTLRRSSVAVAAVAVALGMYLGVTTMIASFRTSVEQWIAHVTKADIYITPAGGMSAPQSGSYLDQSFVDILCNLPETDDCDWVSNRRVAIDGRAVRVTGTRFEILRDHDRLMFRSPMDADAIEALIRDESVVLVSESFAERSRLRVGDSFLLPGLNRTAKLTVGNVFHDYSADQGLILLQHRLFVRLFGEDRKQGVSLYLKPGVSAADLVTQIARRFPEAALVVRDNLGLRTEVLRVFDQTFAVTYALQAIALIISFFTLVNTVTILILERGRELAVLHAIGAGRRTLVGMVASESLLLGLASAAGAAVIGAGLAAILIVVVNRFYFGWTVTLSVPLGRHAVTVGAALSTALLAGAIPGYLFARKHISSEVRYE